MTPRFRGRPTLGGVPCVSADEMREVDRAMIEDFGITLVQMMENAGRALAVLVRDLQASPDATRPVVVLAGAGGNGGGALAAARRLHTWGVPVQVVLSEAATRYRGVPGQQLRTVRLLGIPVAEAQDSLPPAPELIVDGLVGYGLRGAPQGRTAALIEWTLGIDAPVVALDIPSGIDATTGDVGEPAVRATTTVTLALPKTGLATATARPYVGALFLADIGVPPAVYRQPPLGLDFHTPFAGRDLVLLDEPGDGASSSAALPEPRG